MWRKFGVGCEQRTVVRFLVGCFAICFIPSPVSLKAALQLFNIWASRGFAMLPAALGTSVLNIGVDKS